MIGAGISLPTQPDRRLYVDVQERLFFGVRFTGAATFQPARNSIGLDSRTGAAEKGASHTGLFEPGSLATQIVGDVSAILRNTKGWW